MGQNAMPTGSCPSKAWQTRNSVPQSLRIRKLCDSAVENDRFEARKRPNLAKVGGAQHKFGGAVAAPIVEETPPVLGA